MTLVLAALIGIDPGVVANLKDEALRRVHRASPNAAVALRWIRLLSHEMRY